MARARCFTSFLVAMAPLAPIVLSPSSASAGETDPAAAEMLFRRGREAAARGSWSQACTHFAESLRLDPAPGTRLNLADCEEHAGLLARAWQDFEVSASQLPSSDPRHVFAKARASSLERRLSHLIVRLIGAASGARVTRDDIELGEPSLGVPLPVDPGRHTVALTMANAPPRALEVVVAEGETREIVLHGRTGSDPAQPAAPSNTSTNSSSRPAPASTNDGNPRRVFGVAAIGLGVAGIALGSVAGLLAFDGAADVRAHCDADRRCDARGLDGGSRARTWSTVSTIAFVAGVVGVAAFGYAFFVSPTSVGTGASTMGVRGSF